MPLVPGAPAGTGSRHDRDTLWGSTRSLRISSSSQGAERKQSRMLLLDPLPTRSGRGQERWVEHARGSRVRCGRGLWVEMGTVEGPEGHSFCGTRGLGKISGQGFSHLLCLVGAKALLAFPLPSFPPPACFYSFNLIQWFGDIRECAA